MPPRDSHDEFMELCALSTTELLSSEERQRMEEHLRHCDACREVHAQYHALIDCGIPAAAVDATGSAKPTNSTWTLDEAEAELLSRLNDVALTDTCSAGEGTPKAPQNVQSADTAVWRQMWWQFAAGLLLAAALGASLYRFGTQESAKSRTPQISTADRLSASGDTRAYAPQTAANPDVQEVARLRDQLNANAVESAHLHDRDASLTADLQSSHKGQEKLQQELDSLRRQLAASQTQLEETKGRLDIAAGQGAQSDLAKTSLEQQIDELRTELAGRDAELARQRDLLDHDQDIRELMGSRNLYIAEVYDVARNGNTQQPFGRVFYTKGKSLIFYAYDLDQQHGRTTEATFQAWGRRGPDQQHAVNLGVLYVDNAAKKRWVLKSEDQKTLADIDAVFVTAEPHGGSNHPTGKPFLFAYLRIEPNHK